MGAKLTALKPVLALIRRILSSVRGTIFEVAGNKLFKATLEKNLIGRKSRAYGTI